MREISEVNKAKENALSLSEVHHLSLKRHSSSQCSNCAQYAIGRIERTLCRRGVSRLRLETRAR